METWEAAGITETLTSLAMLKVKIDEGGDYLDYIKPFVLQVLVDHRPEPIFDITIHDYLIKDFGLNIPESIIQIVLNRLARKEPIRKENGAFFIKGTLSDPQIHTKKHQAQRHINLVINGLIDFSRTTGRNLNNEAEDMFCIISFLSIFDISCLKASLKATALPVIEDKKHSDIVLVSKFLFFISQNNPNLFDSFMVVVQGHMLANGILCPDLQKSPKTFRDIKFFIDTPLMIPFLNLEGEIKRDAAANLFILLRKLGGHIAVFSHTKDELIRVIEAAAEHLNRNDARSGIIGEARRRRTTKSDLLLLAGHIDDLLLKNRITVISTPEYDPKFQIDEQSFEKVLSDEISYLNPNAILYDIKSVRSIYTLRKGMSPRSIERSIAILVTTNSAFARASWNYGQRYEESRAVSPVITDFSLANIAWLKLPLEAPSLPRDEVMAFSYAALQPSEKFLFKFLDEVDKLRNQGKITIRDHQLLRSSPVAHEILMDLTLGEDEALNFENISKTLDRAEEAIKAKEKEKLFREEEAHKLTKNQLAVTSEEKLRLIKKIKEDSLKKAKIASVITAFIVVILNAGIWVDLANYLNTLFKIVFSFISLTGITFSIIKRYFERFFIKKTSKHYGIDLEYLDNQNE